MTVLLILFMLLLFLGIDHFIHRRTLPAKERTLPAGQPEWMMAHPDGLRLATNHMWMKEEGDNAVLVGLDEFIARTSGVADEVRLPIPGARVNPAVSDIRLCQGPNELEFNTPVTGRVMEVNTKLRTNPELLAKDPYGEGWLLKLRRDPSVDFSDLFSVRESEQWLRQQFQEAVQFFRESLGIREIVTLQDGGVLSEGLLREFGSDTWHRFNDRFATLQRTDTETSSREN